MIDVESAFGLATDGIEMGVLSESALQGML